MGLAYATVIFVLSVLGWVALAVMEYFASSVLCAQIAYVFLVLGLIHLVITSLAVDNKQLSQAYFSSVLAFSIYAIGCMADAFPIYTFSPEKFSLPPGSPKCCANLDVVRTNRVLYFTDSVLFYVQAGVFQGYLTIHLLIAAAGSFDPETQSVWPGHAWGLALLVLLSFRFVILFDNVLVMLCPDLLFYLHIFEQPIVPLRWVYVAFAFLLMALLVIEGFEWDQTVWIYWRALELLLCGAFFGTSVGVLYVRGMLTIGVVGVLLMPFIPVVVGLVQSIGEKIRMDGEAHERMVREFQKRQQEYAPSAPPHAAPPTYPPVNPFNFLPHPAQPTHPPVNPFAPRPAQPTHPPINPFAPHPAQPAPSRPPVNPYSQHHPVNPLRYYSPTLLQMPENKKAL